MFKRIKVYSQDKKYVLTSQETTDPYKLHKDAGDLRKQYPNKVLIVQEWKNNQWVDKKELERA